MGAASGSAFGSVGRNGKPTSFRARALYRDFDGLTREVAAQGPHQERSRGQAFEQVA